MAVAAVDTQIIGGIAAKFRTCPATGLKIDLAAQRLIKANAVAAALLFPNRSMTSSSILNTVILSARRVTGLAVSS
jgi:hypothetical protein